MKNIKLPKWATGLILGICFLFFVFVIVGTLGVDNKAPEPNLPIAQTQSVPQIADCQKSVHEVPAPAGVRFPDRKYYEEIHCGDGVAREFKLSRQLTDIGVYKNGQIQTICSSNCDTNYEPYDSKNVRVVFAIAPAVGSQIKIAGAQALPSEMQKPQAATLGKVVFDLQAIAPKISYTNIKSLLGKPTKEGLPDTLIDLDGWAAWNREGFTLSINYDRYGILKNSKVLGCAISLSPQKGYLAEDDLRRAGNLPKGNSFIIEDRKVGVLFTFSIQPAYDINGKLYAIEVCP